MLQHQEAPARSGAVISIASGKREPLAPRVQAIIDEIEGHIASGRRPKMYGEAAGAYFDRLTDAWNGLRAARRDPALQAAVSTDPVLEDRFERFVEWEVQISERLRKLIPRTARQAIVALDLFQAVVVDDGLEASDDDVCRLVREVSAVLRGLPCQPAAATA